MNTRLKSLIYILIFVLLYAIYYWVVPMVVNIDARVNILEKLVKSELGVKLDIEKPNLKMGLTPSVWLSASELVVTEDDQTKPFFIKEPKLEIRLLPLIFGKFKVAYFACDYISANLKFDRYSRFYIGNYLIMNNSNPRVSLEDSKMNINGYKINIKDELQSKNIVLEGDYFNLLKYNSKKYVKFTTDSKIKVDNKYSVVNVDMDFKLPFKNNFEKNDIVLNGTITDLNLADFSPYFIKFSKNQIRKTAGIVNLEAKTQKISKRINRITSQMVVKNLLIQGIDQPSSVYFKDKLAISTIFDVSRNTLDIKKLKLYAKRLNTDVTGKVTKMTTKNPRLNLLVMVNKSKFEDFVSLIPANKQTSKDINFIALKKYGYYSDIEGNLAIKGKIEKPSLKGQFMATNGYIIKPVPNNVPKATVKLNFLGDKMDMDILVPVANKENVRISGLVDLYGNKKCNINVASTPNIDLKTTLSILNPAHEIFYFDIGPLPIMDISGVGDIKLSIKGTNADPHLIGAFNFRNASMSFKEVAMVVKKTYGTLNFNDTDTHFLTKSAFLNNKPIKVDGKCTLKGVLDFDVTTKGQDLGDLLGIVKNSPMLKDVQKMVMPIEDASGKSDLALKLTGKVINLDEVVFGKTIFASGDIKLLGNNIYINQLKLPVKNTYGEVKFKNTDLKLNLYSMINKSKLFIKGNIKNNKANLAFNSDSLYISDILKYLDKDDVKNLKYTPSFSNTHLNLAGKYNGSLEKLALNKLVFKGKILPNNSPSTELMLKNGTIELKNSILYLNKLSGNYKNNSFYASGSAQNVLSSNQNINGIFVSDNFDISTIKNLTKYPFIPESEKKIIDKFSCPAGHINIKATIKNNVFNSKIKLNDIFMVYAPMNVPVKIYSGTAELKNGKIMLYKVNSLVDSMPLLVDGIIDNVFKKPAFNIYINSKPTQKFIDKYINKDAVYPLKMKGDIIYSARLHGTKDSYSAKTEINLQEDSNIYYMGSTLGDLNNPIRIFLDANVAKNRIYVDNFQYDKLISSQNNKEFISPQLNAKGQIIVNKSNIFLHNFRVKTQNPTDARIFNLLFKKPMIKQGLFTSNVNINGPITTPYMRGDVNFTGVNIPLLDTTIKDISLDFKDNDIIINSTGEIFSNKMVFSASMQNNLNPPYTFDNIDLFFANLDVNSITKTINNLQIEADKHKISTPKQDLDLGKVVIKKAQVKAENVLVKNISAKNLLANLSLNEKLVFALDNFQFDIAQGKAKGNFKYNLLNSQTNLDMKINNVNANLMSDALFDLHDQIFGSLTGEVNLYCNGKTHKTCMDTLGGKGGFVVDDGRMPKLGSLEYLLKAGNLVKSGITGLSINGIVDLITPLKTGQFESIRGNFTISSGIADSIQIFSKGKDLSIFIDGKYNFATLIADMEVFGRLSKKISTVLGPIGNASLNTLFNTIPGLNLDETNKAQFINKINKIPGFELNDKMYRIFNVKIYGDINGDQYVQSFKWVE